MLQVLATTLALQDWVTTIKADTIRGIGVLDRLEFSQVIEAVDFAYVHR